MVGRRNRIIHGYGTVNIAVLLDTLEHELPELVAKLEACILDGNRKGGKERG
ncbi:MAG: HepT-like ribonuclease domain-containing protein [Candidatus Hydrogenedentota bacterium]